MIHKITLLITIVILNITLASASDSKRLAYMVSDINIPFWNIMSKGIKKGASVSGYDVDIYSARNIKKDEIGNLAKIIEKKYAGIVLSPINSSTAVTVLKIAKSANIPVVISDIGTDKGEYVSFISSNNLKGAYEIGKVLADKMTELNYHKDGTVGIIAIPQTRSNGKARTNGFIMALDENDIKTAGLLQQVDFSYKETYDHSITLIKNNPKLKAIWLQGSDKYKGAMDAIKDSGKEGEILLICFDAEPEFLDMIPDGKLVGAAMQQPYLMGEMAANNLVNHINGKEVTKNQELDILAISNKNIKEKLPLIKRNVLGIEK